MAIWLNACERCGGDMVPDQWDRDGNSLVCLQCGREIRRPAEPRDSASVSLLDRVRRDGLAAVTAMDGAR